MLANSFRMEFYNSTHERIILKSELFILILQLFHYKIVEKKSHRGINAEMVS